MKVTVRTIEQKIETLRRVANEMSLPFISYKADSQECAAIAVSIEAMPETDEDDGILPDDVLVAAAAEGIRGGRITHQPVRIDDDDEEFFVVYWPLIQTQPHNANTPSPSHELQVKNEYGHWCRLAVGSITHLVTTAVPAARKQDPSGFFRLVTVIETYPPITA